MTTSVVAAPTSYAPSGSPRTQPALMEMPHDQPGRILTCRSAQCPVRCRRPSARTSDSGRPQDQNRPDGCKRTQCRLDPRHHHHRQASPTVLAIASVSGMLSGAMTWTTGGSVLRRRCGKRGSGMAGGLARLANTIADTRHEDLRESWCAHLAESPDADTARDARGMVTAA